MYLQKVISRKTFKILVSCWRFEGRVPVTKTAGSVSQRYGSADPDPYQNVTDPQHW
jgi:hypothetical protein